MIINGLEFTPEQFLSPKGLHPSGVSNFEALVTAVIAEAKNVLPGVQPGAPPGAHRTFAQTFELTRDIWGIGYRDIPASGETPGRFLVTYAFYKPSGELFTKEYQLDEAVRDALATQEFTGTGDTIVSAAYAAGLPQAQADFRTAWGLPEPE